MNTLEEAAKRLENGWCVGDMASTVGGDKYCAVGAIGSVEKGITARDIVNNPDLDDTLYEDMDESPAIQALAAEIMEQHPTMFSPHMSPTAACFSWNDDQDDVETVLEMFRYAAKRLEK